MGRVIAWMFPAGNFVQEVTSVTLVNTTAKTVDITVPAGKRWMLIGIKASNPDDVNRIITIRKYKEAAKTNEIKTMASSTVTATTGKQQWPSGAGTDAETQRQVYEVAEAGNTYSVTWSDPGASSGGTAADGLVIEYLEVAVSEV
jgi:hypothetical protein